jgi:hypothetical protein
VDRHLGGGLGGRAAGQLRVGSEAAGQGGVELAALAGQQVALLASIYTVPYRWEIHE